MSYYLFAVYFHCETIDTDVLFFYSERVMYPFS